MDPSPSAASGISSDSYQDLSFLEEVESSSKLRKITSHELRQHNHRGSAWVAAGGRVYDITHLLCSGAMGSMASTILNLGGDCTEQFAFIPALKHPEMSQYCIGCLV